MEHLNSIINNYISGKLKNGARLVEQVVEQTEDPSIMLSDKFDQTERDLLKEKLSTLEKSNIASIEKKKRKTSKQFSGQDLKKKLFGLQPDMEVEEVIGWKSHYTLMQERGDWVTCRPLSPEDRELLMKEHSTLTRDELVKVSNDVLHYLCLSLLDDKCEVEKGETVTNSDKLIFNIRFSVPWNETPEECPELQIFKRIPKTFKMSSTEIKLYRHHARQDGQESIEWQMFISTDRNSFAEKVDMVGVLEDIRDKFYETFKLFDLSFEVEVGSTLFCNFNKKLLVSNISELIKAVSFHLIKVGKKPDFKVEYLDAEAEGKILITSQDASFDLPFLLNSFQTGGKVYDPLVAHLNTLEENLSEYKCKVDVKNCSQDYSGKVKSLIEVTLSHIK